MDFNSVYGYDKKDPISIETYSKKMIGKTFRQICDEDKGIPTYFLAEESSYGKSDELEDYRNKGNLGNLIEERFFHYRCNNDSRPDFPEAGVELKVSPYRENKDGSISAKERLILTMIDYFAVVHENFEESHFWNKSKLILLVYYLYRQEIQFRIDYRIGYSALFTPPARDLAIIKQDYDFIVSKIKSGKAHELSEGDTFYLGAAPKAATSKDRRAQPFSTELAKPRAFAFKSSYMTYVLNTYIIPGKKTYEPIIKETETKPFEKYVIDRIESFKGFTEEELCNEFGISFRNKPKSLNAILTYRMLGIEGNHAEEFEKANIVIKTIRVGFNGKIKENMSFPTFRFVDLIKEEWDDSSFGNYLRETKFLFVVYKFDKKGILRLSGCQFWNMPYDDLENEVRVVWERTVTVLREGLRIKEVNGRRYNNLPKASDNRVCHVRPHAQNANDTYNLPDGRPFPKQCFWLNNDYILSQLRSDLK